MNSWCSPSWIVGNHLKNQGSNLFAHRLATAPRLGSGKPFPIQPKTGTMPADNGSGCHLDQRFLPSSPALSQYDPEQLVGRSESPARALGVKSEQLLTQGKIFEDDILAGPECTNNAAEEVPEPYDHAQNLTGTLPIELGAKSLILRVYDVLMNDNDLVDQLFSDSEKRLARVLLLMAHFGKEEVVDIPVSGLSQGTLAEMVGTTRSRVSFFMNRFRKLGFINYDARDNLRVHSSLLSVCAER